MPKFKIGDKVIKANGEGWVTGEKYKKITSENSLFGYTVNRCLGYWKEEELELYKENEMEKSFREVIADIKPGEVWGCKEINRQIVRGDGEFIEIRKIDGRAFDNAVGLIVGNEKYTLQRKEYTFEEAFKAYEEGKEIESIETGEICCKSDWIRKYGNDNEGTISRLAIRNKWYIND